MRQIDQICYDMAGDLVDFMVKAMEDKRMASLNLRTMFETSVVENFNGTQEDYNDIGDLISEAVVHVLKVMDPKQFRACPQSFRLILAGHLVFALRNVTLREYENG